MDLENAANVHVSEEKKKRIQKEIDESVEESINAHNKWIKQMRKLGHSDEEINRIMCF